MAESDWLMEIGSCEDHTSALYQDLMRRDDSDKRSIALARTYLEIGFMWMRRGALRRHNNVWDDDGPPREFNIAPLRREGEPATLEPKPGWDYKLILEVTEFRDELDPTAAPQTIEILDKILASLGEGRPG